MVVLISSSSFIVLGTKKTITEAKEKLSDFGKAVVEDIARDFQEVTLDGKKYQMAQGSYSTEEFASSACDKFSGDDEDKNYELGEKATEEWSTFLENVKKLGGLANEEGC